MQSLEERQCIEVVGFDPGSKALGVGAVRFFGLFDVKDDEGNIIGTVPDIEILAAERWDLTRGIVVMSSPDQKAKRQINVKPGPVKESGAMLDWGESLARMVTRCDYIYRPHRSMLDKGALRLPVLLVENQCDRQKSAFLKYEMTLIQHQISAATLGVDYYTELRTEDKTTLPLPRINCLGMRKYGQRSDGSRERLERKKQAVDDVKQLLTQLNNESSLRWLNWFLLMERMGEQIHDMCDGILSAVDKCERLCEDQTRSEIAEKRAFIKRIPYAPTRPRKVPVKKKAAASDDEEEDEEEEKPKKKRAPAKSKEKKVPAKKTVKRKKGEEVEEEVEVFKTKKRKMKKIVESEGFPQLLLDIRDDEDEVDIMK